MAVFEYIAMLESQPTSGTIIADSPRQARDALRDRGLAVCQVKASSRRGEGGSSSRLSGRRQMEMIEFVRELATMLSAGISLLPALGTLAGQHRGRFRTVIQRLWDDVSAGLSLADAMEAQPENFDEMAVSMVRVGQTTGSLEQSLKRLADFKEKTHRLGSQITSALIYPTMVCCMGLGVMIFLMTYVVPNLIGSLTQAGKELPAVTKCVKAVSDFLTGWWWAILLFIAAVVVACRQALKNAKIKFFVDGLILKLPVLGSLVGREIVSRMSVVLSALLKSGLDFVQALEITRRTIRNRVFVRALEHYQQAVVAGRDVAGPLAASGIFSPMVVQMMAVGQQSGELEEMLDHLAESYDKQVATAAQRFVAVLEPLLIILMALMVGVIALATILPILESSNVL